MSLIAHPPRSLFTRPPRRCRTLSAGRKQEARIALSACNPPGPKGHWLKGSLPEFRHDRLGFFARMRDEFGDVVGLRLAHRRVFFLFHPSAIEEVLLTRAAHFRKHFALRLNPLVLGKGLLTSEGDFWLRQRRLVQPAFNRGRLASYGPPMIAAARRLCESWRPGEP